MKRSPNFAQYSGLMPRRSRTSVSVRSRRSHSAIANMPINWCSVFSRPKAAIDSTMTSVSEWPRNAMPLSEGRMSSWL